MKKNIKHSVNGKNLTLRIVNKIQSNFNLTKKVKANLTCKNSTPNYHNQSQYEFNL